jgi:hypothetical protein
MLHRPTQFKAGLLVVVDGPGLRSGDGAPPVMRTAKRSANDSARSDRASPDRRYATGNGVPGVRRRAMR